MARLKTGESVTTSNGVELRLIADGPGPEVVGMSGIGTRGTDPDVWGDLPTALERRFIGVDLRQAMGRLAAKRFGMASGMYPASFYEYGQLAKDGFREMAFKGELSRPSPDTVAVSWGASLASNMKDADSTSLGKVVAISAPPDGMSIPAFRAQMAIYTQTMKRLMGDGSVSKELAQELYGGSMDDYEAVAKKFDLFKHPDLADIEADMLQLRAIQGEAMLGRGVTDTWMRMWGLTPKPRDIPDVLFINGEEDPIAPPSLRSHMIRRGGHLIHLTHAEEVADYANWHFGPVPKTRDDVVLPPLAA